MNRLAILRVTQMCTTILSAVHEEFARGGHVDDLAGPVAKLQRYTKLGTKYVIGLLMNVQVLLKNFSLV